jgi:isopenicillin N synthase-like dioxygenase
MKFSAMIPLINVTPLFGDAPAARNACDAEIIRAATEIGFMVITGLPAWAPHGAAARSGLLRLFSLDPAKQATLSRRKFAPGNPNVYRGWFPLSPEGATYKEGIDIGPDVARPDRADASDPLTEPTPLPAEADLPGWRSDVAAYYIGFERLGGVLLRSLARGLNLPEAAFDAVFAEGVSTLRLIHYPERSAESLALLNPDEAFVFHQGQRRLVAGAAHIDSGFVTLLAQDGVEGLQARGADGGWIDVPPIENSLAVNFGGLLERWTGGRVKATEHRVLSPERRRFSIPFFYEPGENARIEPLPGLDAPPFAPFLYGDHVWASMMKFVEFSGLESARPPRGA